MAHTKKKKIVPLYIKDAKNKVTDVYLDIKTYSAIIQKISKFKKTRIKKVAQK
jgi:hypothetical protein